MDNIIYTNLGEETETAQWWINFNNKHINDCELEKLSHRYFEIFQEYNAIPVIHNKILTGLKFEKTQYKTIFLLQYG